MATLCENWCGESLCLLTSSANQNRRSKSSHESMEFWLDCQRAKCFGHLNDVRSKLNDRELFQKLVLHVKGCTEAPFLHGVEAESPEAEAANDLCQPVGKNHPGGHLSTVCVVVPRTRGARTSSSLRWTKASPPAL